MMKSLYTEAFTLGLQHNTYLQIRAYLVRLIRIIGELINQ
jgi:hypothetical protein